MALVPADNEKYDVLEIIGRGAFGIIRKVRRKSDGYILCRKEINYLKMSPKERDQLHSEFSILASLKHPNIVGYFHREHLKQTQELYLYMEYCGGGDLGSIIKGLKRRREYAKEEFVWRILSQLITALYRCHYGIHPPEPGSDFSRQKDGKPKGKDMILHRDLKPENIFLGEDQSVKLGDFGLSKLMQSHDFASTYVGTPFYMSPEICAAERYTLHSDIWSVGCIMYELCTHEPPFNAQTHLQLIQKIRKGDFAPLPSIYSKDLANVIASCLKVNPNHRPDAASLLTVPYIWIARRQQEMVGISKHLKTKEEVADQKLKLAEERLGAMEADREYMRVEMEAQLRREWEVKARLEIDRQVQIELDRLRSQFDKEVEERVGALVSRQDRSTDSRALKDIPNLPTKKDHSSSVNTMGEEEFPSTTDITDISDLSIHSPSTSNNQAIPPKKTKTPFARSKTTFDSPVDVQMSEPSPISISGLALSPRRNPAAQATANSTTTAVGVKNIFAEAARHKARWEPTLADNSEDEEDGLSPEDESDDDSILELRSPTRTKATVASTDPFKQPNPLPLKNRPGLGRQATMATMQKLTSKPTLFPTMYTQQQTAKAEAVKASIAAATASSLPRTNTEQEMHNTMAMGARPTSPGRRVSKIPSRNDFMIHEGNTGSTSPRRANSNSGTALKSKLKGGSNSSAKENTNTKTVGGRTLVELAQARAGGRPMSGDLSNLNLAIKDGKKGLVNVLERELPPVPIWDPELEGDNMPSPFLKRVKGDVAMRGVR